MRHIVVLQFVKILYDPDRERGVMGRESEREREEREESQEMRKKKKEKEEENKQQRPTSFFVKFSTSYVDFFAISSLIESSRVIATSMASDNG